jgi:23S rRNA (cytosine1962-C5)-methyltransferase
MPLKLLTPSSINIDYELIDSGNGEKLERFGAYILRRPEPQAVWLPSISERNWISMANATFKRDKTQFEQDKGQWNLKPDMPGQWLVNYNWQTVNIKMRMGLTSFKHVGLFPEQAENWNFIYDRVNKSISKNPKILNLFAYTGGASLVARAAGADVVHVDSVRQVINWAAENMAVNNLDRIHWVVEDAMKFIKREVKREKKYNGIILDPPAYGHGPSGEKWVLEDSINELMQCCSCLLEEKDSFLVLNLYSMGFSSLIAENLVKTNFKAADEIESGELYFPDRSGNRLPLGVYTRIVL